MPELSGVNDELIEKILARLRKLHERIIRNPDARIDYMREIQAINSMYGEWLDQARRTTEAQAARGYVSGVKKANRAPIRPRQAASVMATIGSPQAGVVISEVAAAILADYPEHHTMFSVFSQAIKDGLEKTRLPVIRSVSDKIRRIGILASEAAYRESETLTRRQLSQRLMNEFVKEGVTGIARSDGATMRLDTYSEMLARSQTLNASRQGNLNRLQERGNDLVLISEHYRCSNLCENYQGRIFSLSGESEEYPALEEATEPSEEGHLFHWNCRHTLSPYIPGLTEVPKPGETHRRNQEMYEAEQRQRAIERNIREWKRREVAALTDVEKDKAKRYVESWQKRQREHIDANKFLRRDYSREQIAI